MAIAPMNDLFKKTVGYMMYLEIDFEIGETAKHRYKATSDSIECLFTSMTENVFYVNKKADDKGRLESFENITAFLDEQKATSLGPFSF